MFWCVNVLTGFIVVLLLLWGQSNEIDLDALLLMEEKDFSEIELPKVIV